MNAAQPLCRFVLSRRSILDTLFVNQTPRRPAYATTTNGSVTTLWCINYRGRLSEVAQIRWQGDSINPTSGTVVVNGQAMLVDNVLKRTKSFFGSDSRTFTAGTTRCKWKTGKHGFQSPLQANGGQSTASHLMNTSWQVWTCCEITTPSHGRRPNTGTSTSTGSPPVLAAFYPPQTGLIKSEITVFPGGEAIVDHVILTAILICARKDEWRTAQSTLTGTALEASLKAEIRGTLPPYIPVTADRYRVSAPRPLRRPPSTSHARARHNTPPAPPPYTSVDDISLPNR
ncbi:hypothetical protein JB92DRAFT_3111201 [Gautieria morchelliformis]|nr:hypothetical protein JB92DRAFT_3111201 [Gautieria morchelliformis]